ncbi:hypothetical protein [Phytopseudomonas daroniae]|uniref:hypothetical protein n=1 Tax=Phytopseudomonas daroniae TaxID=2487519 RepID=UPI001038427A|nr:hypothetical protein [Pseudomonas daroniae]
MPNSIATRDYMIRSKARAIKINPLKSITSNKQKQTTHQTGASSNRQTGTMPQTVAQPRITLFSSTCMQRDTRNKKVTGGYG